jgi:hypothetical protein
MDVIQKNYYYCDTSRTGAGLLRCKRLQPASNNNRKTVRAFVLPFGQRTAVGTGCR